MNTRGFMGLNTLMLLLACGLAQAAPATSTYRIDMTVSLNGSLVGRPAIIAEPGAEAEIRVEDPAKPDYGFRILVSASPLEAAQADKPSAKLELSFFGRAQGKWVLRGEHSVVTLMGLPVSFGFPSKPPEAKGKTYDLVVVVNPSSAVVSPK